MATKKKKPVSAEFNTVDPERTAQDSAENMSESDKLQAKAGVVEVSMSEEIKLKLDAYERLAEENAKYAQEISDLQDRMAKYIQEIQDLKKERETPSAIADNVSNDRIAELEAENSRLLAQLNVMRSATAPQQKPKPRIQPNCYRRRIIDGYQAWN